MCQNMHTSPIFTRLKLQDKSILFKIKFQKSNLEKKLTTLLTGITYFMKQCFKEFNFLCHTSIQYCFNKGFVSEVEDSINFYRAVLSFIHSTNYLVQGTLTPSLKNLRPNKYSHRDLEPSRVCSAIHSQLHHFYK